MKKLLLALLFVAGCASSAFAACGGSTAQMKDNASSTFNMALVNDPSGSNCASVISVAPNSTAYSNWALVAASTAGATAPTNVLVGGGVYNSGAIALTNGQALGLQLTTAGSLHTTVDNSTTAIPNNSDAVAVQTGASNSPVNNYDYLFNGTTWDRARSAPGQTGSLAVGSQDPCLGGAKVNFAIATSSGNVQIVGGSASKKVYLCSISLIVAATAVVNVIEGTGAACTTANEAAVIGSTTAANGMSLAANGGFTLGNGLGTVGVTATAANGLCILQSGTTAIAGNATYVQQ